MSILLSGGGDGPAWRAALGRLVDEARAHANGAAPRIVGVLVGSAAEPGRWGERVPERLREAGAGEVEVLEIGIDAAGRPERAVDLAEIARADGLVVGGGLTPAYLEALAPVSTDLRRLIVEGVPYLGSSAGAMIAPASALVGGWRIGGVPVVREGWSEGLDEVELREGLGLLDVTVDVHAAERGLLVRAIAAVEAGLAEAILAIDEEAVLAVGEGQLEILGPASVWRILAGEDGVLVRSDRAPEQA